jgi:hypothetical protein
VGISNTRKLTKHSTRVADAVTKLADDMHDLQVREVLSNQCLLYINMT